MRLSLSRRWIPILVVLSACGVTPEAFLECGQELCPVTPGAYCAVCPGAGAPTFSCGTRPADDMRPDWWQPSLVCAGRRGDVAFFECDSHDDCTSDAQCVAVAPAGNIPFAVCRARAETTEWCARPTAAIVCRGLSDCPACATGCEPIETGNPTAAGFPLKRCAY